MLTFFIGGLLIIFAWVVPELRQIKKTLNRIKIDIERLEGVLGKGADE